MLYNQRPGYKLLPLKGANPTPPTLLDRIIGAINSIINSRDVVLGNSGSFSLPVVAVAFVTVTIPTQPSTTYQVVVTPTSLIGTIVYFVTNKTTTSFDVVYVAPVTGLLEFDWLVIK